MTIKMRAVQKTRKHQYCAVCERLIHVGEKAIYAFGGEQYGTPQGIYTCLQCSSSENVLPEWREFAQKHFETLPPVVIYRGKSDSAWGNE